MTAESLDRVGAPEGASHANSPAARQAAPPRSRRWSSAVWLAAAALVLLAAGCASEAAEGERLEDFLGGPGPMMPAQEEQRQIEEHVAACMADEGFEYIPREPRDPEEPPVAFAGHPREKLDEDEFREEYGYGISTYRPEPDEQPDPLADDPNHDIREEMDDAEREAYEKALHGEGMPMMGPPGVTPPEVHEDDGDDEEESDPGCRQQARDAVLGDKQEARDELQSELMDLHEAAQSDPRIAEANQQWAACMRERGWDVSEPHDAQRKIMEEHQQEVMDWPDPREMEEMADADDGEFEPPEPDVDEAALEELQERELEIAADDHECAEAHDLDGVREEVRAEHEREFIEEHRDTLEQLRD